MRRKTANGFTLVEATIVVAILAMAAGVTVIEVGSITRADLRASASKLAGAVRATYDQACLSGQTQRLVFELASSTVRAESTSGMVSFLEGQNAHREADAEAPQNQSDLAGFLGVELPPPEATDGDASAPSAADGAGLLSAFLAGGGGGGASAGPATFSPGETLSLDGSVKVLDVWVEGMGEVAKEGTVYLYFFPNGSTQDAIVNLQDDDGNVFHLRVRALTGKSSIDAGYKEPPK